MEKVFIDQDALADSQIISKMWVCSWLESWFKNDKPRVWVYGGWCGILPLMMMVRGIDVTHIRLFDIDPEAVKNANNVMQAWARGWKFHAEVRDVNMIMDHEDADVIINTSTEHMEDTSWFQNIRSGKKVILQSTNQFDDDHFNRCDTLEEFQTKFPLSSTLLAGEKEFVYRDRVFNRFMLVGVV